MKGIGIVLIVLLFTIPMALYFSMIQNHTIDGYCYINSSDLDYFDSIMVDSTGDVLVFGQVTEENGTDISYGHPNEDGLLLERFSSNGTLEQNLSIYVNGYSLWYDLDSKDNILIAFILTYGGTVVQNRTITGGGLLVKLSPSGEILWMADDLPDLRGVTVDSDDDIYVVGTEKGTSAKYNLTRSFGRSFKTEHIAIYAFSPDGENTEYIQISGTSSDRGLDIVVDELGGIYVLARTSVDFLGEIDYESRYRIVKLSANRTLDWVRSFTLTGINEITAMSDGIAILGANVTTSKEETVVLKLDIDGYVEWSYSTHIDYGYESIWVYDNKVYLHQTYHVIRLTSNEQLIYDATSSKIRDFVISGGRFFLLGSTSNEILIQNPTYQGHINGESDAFVLVNEFNGSVGREIWGTYLGWGSVEVSTCLG